MELPDIYLELKRRDYALYREAIQSSETVILSLKSEITSKEAAMIERAFVAVYLKFTKPF